MQLPIFVAAINKIIILPALKLVLKACSKILLADAIVSVFHLGI